MGLPKLMKGSFTGRILTYLTCFMPNLLHQLTKRLLKVLVPALFLSGHGYAQTRQPLPRIIRNDGRYMFMVDGKPFFMLGGQAHNSSAWPGLMPGVWHAIEKLHANTLEVPVYWEQVEAVKDQFDFSVVDLLLAQARAHHVRLVLLWFGTWKNGSSHYMPGWMKSEPAKYPNIIGKKGQLVDSPSPHSAATLAADINAFTHVMQRLKQADPQHTVIMVQVENEPGSWDTVRDYSPAAQRLFEGPVPVELLKPEILKALHHPNATSDTWRDVFGDDADEYFHAWSVAHFIGQIAAAGKAIYPLPLYVNCALRDPLTNPPATNYESGGPTDNVIPIWKAAAPAIDLLAPDVYLNGSDKVLKVLDLYGRRDNPLFVPEAALIPEKAKYLYEVLARGGIGFSPFGIDDNGQDIPDSSLTKKLLPFSQEYAMAAPMMPQLAQWAAEGKIKAAVEREDHAEQTIDLGTWQTTITFGNSRSMNSEQHEDTLGKLMIVQLEENKFIVTGTDSHITFKPAGASPARAWQYFKVEEGKYENGVFKPLRILNGDETDFGGPRLGHVPVVLQVQLILRER